VYPALVVKARILLQHGSGVPRVGGQEPVEDFYADRADEALGDRARPRCPPGVVTIPTPIAVKHSVEG
jgi:hypothetical protein